MYWFLNILEVTVAGFFVTDWMITLLISENKSKFLMR